MEDIVIRRAAPDDANAASRLAWRAKAGWGYPASWMEQWRDALVIRPEALRDHLALVAVRGEELLGVCVVELPDPRGDPVPSPRAGVLDQLWVAPEAQGRGLGKRLVEEVLALAAEAGLQRIDIESDPFAEPFYLRIGARVVGSRPAPMPGATERVLHLMEMSVPLPPRISSPALASSAQHASSRDLNVPIWEGEVRMAEDFDDLQGDLQRAFEGEDDEADPDHT